MPILPCAGDAAEFEMAIALNLTAPILLTKAFAAGMVKNKVCSCAFFWRLLRLYKHESLRNSQNVLRDLKHQST